MRCATITARTRTRSSLRIRRCAKMTIRECVYDSRTLMRPSCGLPLAIRVAVFTILPGLLFGRLQPRVSYAQAASTLPKSWNDAVAKLADEVAAAMSPTAVVKLERENISSLDASYVARLKRGLCETIAAPQFCVSRRKFYCGAIGGCRLQLTLSESATEYVVGNANSQRSERTRTVAPMMIVSAPKSDFADAEAEAQTLSLEKRFVWKQAGTVFGLCALERCDFW